MEKRFRRGSLAQWTFGRVRQVDLRMKKERDAGIEQDSQNTTNNQSPKKIGEDIAKATGDWKGLRVTVQLTIQNRQATVAVVPSASSLVIKALKGESIFQGYGLVEREDFGNWNEEGSWTGLEEELEDQTACYITARMSTNVQNPQGTERRRRTSSTLETFPSTRSTT
jgi:hypothetical protein